MRYLARLLTVAIVATLACASGSVSANDRGWLSLFDKTQPRPEAGIMFARWGSSPVSITSIALGKARSGPDARLISVAVFNPDWERVEAARIFWALYRDDNLNVPKGDGRLANAHLRQAALDPRQCHNEGQVSLPVPEDRFTYRLEVGVDTILYQGGTVWQRPLPPESASLLTAQPN